MRVHWTRAAGVVVASGVVTAGLIGWLSAYQDQEIPRCTDSIADSGGICQGLPTWDDKTLPPCATEDSDNCYWDAQTMGNGKGHDSVVVVDPAPATVLPTPKQTSAPVQNSETKPAPAPVKVKVAPKPVTPAPKAPTPKPGLAVIYDENDMLIYEDGTWHDNITGFDGCMEAGPCDHSGKYEIVADYPAGWPDNGRYCWGNLLEQVVCLKEGVTP